MVCAIAPLFILNSAILLPQSPTFVFSLFENGPLTLEIQGLEAFFIFNKYPKNT